MDNAVITRIDLLRHGETDSTDSFCGSTDSVLTQAGRSQMWSRVRETQMPWRVIVTSPLQRCADFAHELAAHCAIPVVSDERLEEIDFGLWEGVKIAELMNAHAQALTAFWTDPVRFTPPQAESVTDFQQRVLDAWADIVSQYLGSHILLITHGGVMRIVQCHIQYYSLQRLLEFEVPHAALHAIEIRHQGDADSYALIQSG